MNEWYIFSIFLHVVFASFWIGGMLFLPLVLLPSIKDHPDRTLLLYKTGIRFRFVGWIALILLVITGVTNMLTRGIPFETDFFINSEYGELLIIKLILFSVMIMIGAVHDFYIGKKALEDHIRTPDPFFRKLAQWSGRLNLLLALCIAFIGIALSRGWY